LRVVEQELTSDGIESWSVATYQALSAAKLAPNASTLSGIGASSSVASATTSVAKGND